MKKVIVPSCIIIVILVFVVLQSNSNEYREKRVKSSIALQLSDLMEDNNINDVRNSDITIIGSPDIIDSNKVLVVEKSLIELVQSTDSHIEQILYRKGYITSYNKDTKCPNWVAWRLTRENTDGQYSRRGVPFFSDDGIALGIGRVTPETCKNGYFVDLESEEPRQQLSDWTRDYNMSHGHMCPAGDNKWDKAAMNQSFLLTNMCPQDAKLNSGGWNSLEEKCRTWAKLYGDIYIIAGPIFNEPITRTIGAGKIPVPDAFFKVVLCLEGTPKAIGFVYKNDSTSQLMKDRVCSVDDVEELTGFDFFHSLPDDVENDVESTSNINLW